MNLQSNTFLQDGKYMIIRFIASGGFGCTYEAVHVMLKKRVAIKEFFVKDFCNRDEYSAHVVVGTLSKQQLVEKLKYKFIEEARALSELHHKNIVRVTDVFEENGTAYFVMDYIEGMSLGDIVEMNGALPEDAALKYIRQVASALEYVHNNNRLHLDIKPDNIMVDGNFNAILIDFGVSKQYDEGNGQNTSTLLGSTPGYAPPEQMSNSVKRFVPATDIYALGATLYKLLTGKTPLDATLLISGETNDPLPTNISQKTCLAVMSAMRLNKKGRPQTMKDFISILDRNMPPNNVTRTKVSETRKPQKAKSKIVYPLILLAIIGIASVIFFTISTSFSTQDEKIASDKAYSDTISVTNATKITPARTDTPVIDSSREKNNSNNEIKTTTKKSKKTVSEKKVKPEPNPYDYKEEVHNDMSVERKEPPVKKVENMSVKHNESHFVEKSLSQEELDKMKSK